MKTLNLVVIEGNMVREPTFKITAKGTAMCNFSIAANRSYKKGDEYFDVETWAHLAKLCDENGAKGRCVRVVGRLKQDRWTDLEGKKCSKVKIIAEHVEFKPIPEKDNKGINYD